MGRLRTVCASCFGVINILGGARLNAEGKSRNEKLAKRTDHAGDNEAVQEQVQIGEIQE